MSRRHQRRDRRRLSATEFDVEVVHQRAILVGLVTDGDSESRASRSLTELAQLTETAGAQTVSRRLQRRATPDPATYIGSGKVHEIETLIKALGADLVVMDAEISPGQQRNLEAVFSVDVVDRVAVILDIFALHATSQEGMLQVELAQLRYRLPRLRGRGGEMSQQGAGIGTRGPGETQLEVDRRRIQRRITKLERDLDRLARTRATQRKARNRSGRRRVALVGYTNAGKSTLLNRLTDSDVLVHDQLFSTLDPTTRRLRLPSGTGALASDTVGFLCRLPHELVQAFRSTLEEVADVDLLVHLVDASTPDVDVVQRAVRQVLDEVGAGDVPELVVWNKIDLADRLDVKRLVADHPGSVAISAASGEGLDDLRRAIESRLRTLDPLVELFVPYDRGDVVAAVHKAGEVVVERHEPAGTRLRARLAASAQGGFRDYRVDAPEA